MDFSTAISQATLNIKDKSRTNLFAWRGQFSPQLIESLLSAYGKNASHIFDPFVGSGTTLYEAARFGKAATGTEVNPAAFSFSRIYKFSNLQTKLRDEKIAQLDELLIENLAKALPLFGGEKDISEILRNLYFSSEISKDKYIKDLFEALIVRLDIYKNKLTPEYVLNTWSKIKTIVDSLPFSLEPVNSYLSDARCTPLKEDTVDFVVTSPPYINVFNYHQNYRRSVEMLGWDVLSVAKSEIGANRKFRSNRFLTVVQYCMDMAQVFIELLRVCQNYSKLIFIVGRESNVRKTAFYNAELLKTIAVELLDIEFVQQQHRVFKNKFGKNIFEELIHLKINRKYRHIKLDETVNLARTVGVAALKKALEYAPSESKTDLEDAIEKSQTVKYSPIFNALKEDK
jgi:DNA modification methylase